MAARRRSKIGAQQPQLQPFADRVVDVPCGVFPVQPGLDEPLPGALRADALVETTPDEGRDGIERVKGLRGLAENGRMSLEQREGGARGGAHGEFRRIFIAMTIGQLHFDRIRSAA